MIEKYTLMQWLAFFFVYCFFGWVIESTIVSVTKRKLVNRGFLSGPILPLYGFGAVNMLMTTIALEDNIVLVYIAGSLSATILECFTGIAMEALLKIKYWDYSDKRFNLHGYICLSSSLFWGVLSVFLLYVVHAPISRVVTGIDQGLLTVLLYLISVGFVVDCTVSLRKNFNLQKLLSYQTKIKQEITELTLKIASIRSNRSSGSGFGSGLNFGRLGKGEGSDSTVKTKTEEKDMFPEEITFLTQEAQESEHPEREQFVNRNKRANSTNHTKDISIWDMEEGIKKLEAYREKLKADLESTKEKALSLKTSLKSFPSATSKKFNEALQDLKMRFK